MRKEQKPLSELAGLLTPYPQELINVPAPNKPDLKDNSAVQDAVARVEQQLHGRGRVLLRYSGTEPLCRVMVEGPDIDEVRELAAGLAAVVRQTCQ